MTCDEECELWIQDIGDLEGSGGNKSERLELIKLNDMQLLNRLEWDRYAVVSLTLDYARN